jgi:chromosome segregation ATPase
MTIEQGKQINELYTNYNDTINNLKNSINLKRFQYDSINQEIRNKQDSFYNWKWKYEANRESYNSRQKDYWKTEKIHEASKLILVGIIILQFTTIGQLQDKINHR